MLTLSLGRVQIVGSLPSCWRSGGNEMAIRVAHALDVVWRNVDGQQVPFAQQKAMGSHDIDQPFALGGYNGTRSSSCGSSVAALGVGYKAKRPHLCSQSTGLCMFTTWHSCPRDRCRVGTRGFGCAYTVHVEIGTFPTARLDLE